MVALAAGGSDPALLASQAIDFGVPVIAVARGTSAQDVQLALYAEAQRRGYQHGDFSLPRIIVGPDAAEQVRRWSVRHRAQRDQGADCGRPGGAGQRSDIGARQQESLSSAARWSWPLPNQVRSCPSTLSTRLLSACAEGVSPRSASSC